MGFGIEAHYLLREYRLVAEILPKPLLLSWVVVGHKVRALIMFYSIEIFGYTEIILQ